MGYPATHLSLVSAAVGNRFVVSTNMIVGAYALANGGAMPSAAGRHITVTHVQVGGVTDTLGTIQVVGRDLSGQTITETITPVSGSTVTGTKVFAVVTSVTGVGWVLNTGNDTITVGCDANAIVTDGSGTLWGIMVNTTAAGTVTVADSTGTLAILKASIAEGFYPFNMTFSGFLSITNAGGSDLTVLADPTTPKTYSMA